MTQSSVGNHYFVDEAGDLTLFNKRGRIIVGTEGVSTTFMLGIAELPDPDAAAAALDGLRRELLADSYFNGVPSMQPNGRKTALCFHAKDDVAEVRREVFKVIRGLGARVRVAVRRKHALAVEARELHTRGLKLRADDVYDGLVKRLASDLPDRPTPNVLVFARRGKANRTSALANAVMQQEKREWPHKVEVRFSSFAEYQAFARAGGLERLQRVMEEMKTTPNDPSAPPRSRFAPGIVASGYPHQFAGLQVADYFLWALQRMFERGEERFFNLLSSDFELIVDLDDKRRVAEGEMYDESNPLTIAKLMPAAS